MIGSGIFTVIGTAIGGNPEKLASWTGSPIIDNALAYVDCKVAEELTSGTHTIFIGAVRACSYRDGEPLGYFDGEYRDFACRIP